MRPTLFEIGTISFPAYLTFVMLGFLAAAAYARRRGEGRGLDGTAIVDTCIVALVSGIAGARLLAVLTDGSLADFIHLCTDPELVDAADAKVRFCSEDAECGYDYLCDLDSLDTVVAGKRSSMCTPPRDCLAVLKFWRGGLTYYGGLVLATPSALWYARRKGIAASTMADVAAPALMLGLSIGRLGCFFNGCCYGSETDAVLGVAFPQHALARHPTQLYESATALLLFAFLHLRFRDRPPWSSFAFMLTAYSGYRLVIELLRADPRGAWGPLSTSQIIALPLFATGIWLWHRSARSP